MVNYYGRYCWMHIKDYLDTWMALKKGLMEVLGFFFHIDIIINNSCLIKRGVYLRSGWY